MRPSVGFAAVRLLESNGCTVHVPETQTCCGQPAYNAGDASAARALASNVIAAFEGFDYIVAPSGSCAGMIKLHYPALFQDDAVMAGRAQAMANKTHELMEFLSDVLGVSESGADFRATVTYQDSCAGLREMGIKEQPRKLMDTVGGLELKELEDSEGWCGFGGLFSVKYPDISGKIVDDKALAIEQTGADVLLGGDLGCLMNIAGRLQRRGSSVKVRHLAEVLAGMTGEVPPIGEAKE
ncbi:MAG: (Fe-S)-binding protein [Rhodospirillales bacterium]|nr:(Fe-S)-binding protein [Rhodospirillales bacterium]